MVGVAAGFVFSPMTTAALGDAIDRANDAYSDKGLRGAMIRQAMRQSVGWERSAEEYEGLYRGLLATRHGPADAPDN